MCGRSTISVAMLSALVTTVSDGCSPMARSWRAASCRAVPDVVVPPLKPTTCPTVTRAAAAAAIVSFWLPPLLR